MQRFKNYLFFLIYIVVNPRLFKLILAGVYIPVYLQYEWTRSFEFTTLIDVGAYRGEVTKVFSRLFPKSKIYAFEPVKSNFEKLRDLFDSDRIKIINLAVSDKNGPSSFYINNYLPASSLLPLSKKYKSEYRVLAKTSKTVIETTKLDEYFKGKSIEEKIFLKIDTQGSELLVLRGCEKLLNKVSAIHIETAFEDLYKGQCEFDKVYSYLIERGFMFKGYALDSDFYPNFGLPRVQNSIFLNSKYHSSKK